MVFDGPVSFGYCTLLHLGVDITDGEEAGSGSKQHLSFPHETIDDAEHIRDNENNSQHCLISCVMRICSQLIIIICFNEPPVFTLCQWL
ncbi:hypothetical protein BBBOND_0305100 [Babesia bigemina]|uniref:Uncharacterized protein n=1 Tax=Babesia bigemina TaxID=5866 RepID=A0A061D9D6_BABBI|nr:hypothetical protein BBBOND_0305100 [Babesia bigemina]CDR96607.1 hypothetical protein BBBOND_0305100 [Babesia bigemina]|eukprot:XP_012768793.1 hypothetical protein BBBOND_0305100 [Babesia bigemina]